MHGNRASLSPADRLAYFDGELSKSWDCVVEASGNVREDLVIDGGWKQVVDELLQLQGSNSKHGHVINVSR